LYDEQERALQRQNIELNDRVKKFERQLEVLKHDQPVEEIIYSIYENFLSIYLERL
jgi:hypothetical protein